MRIVFVISVVGKVKRGGESTSRGLVAYLARHTEVTVISGGEFRYHHTLDIGFPQITGFEKLYDRLPDRMKFRLIRRLHYDPLSVRNLLFCKRALSHIKQLLPDLIVFRSVGPWGAKLGRLIRRRYNIPFVTIEGGWQKGERETARYHPNLHISVNLDVCEYLRNQLPEVAVAYLPNGICLDDFSPHGPKADLALPQPVILGCGYLGDVKRFELTIDAVRRMPTGSLLLLGRGDREDYLRRLGFRLLPNRFQIKSVPYEMVPDYYRAADVVTVPSAGESFGMTYLEAMACNKPVVATDDRNRRAVIGKAGILVDPRRIDDYARALTYCTEVDFEDRPLEQAAKFDWNILGPKYLAAFDQVLDQARRNSHRRFPVYRRMG